MSFFKSPLFWLGVLLIVLVAIGTWSYCNWGWLRQVAEGRESNSATLRNVSLVVGGLIAIWFGVWRTNVADRQAKAAQEQANTARRQANTTEQGLLDDRYERGSAMLSSEVLPLRLAGIQTLERIATEHPVQYFNQVMNLLCSYARNPTQDEGDDVSESSVSTGSPLLMSPRREDLRATMAAISNLNSLSRDLEDRSEHLPLDLRRADLRYVDLYMANLANADLSEANLIGANFHSADLTNASLLGAIICSPIPQDQWTWEEYESAKQSHALLDGANMSGTRLSLLGRFQVQGLLQRELDKACASPVNPPKLDDISDAETGVPLVWQGKDCSN